MSRLDELTDKFNETGGLSSFEGVELFQKIDVMRKFIEFLASGEKYYMEDVYYDAQAILNKL